MLTALRNRVPRSVALRDYGSHAIFAAVVLAFTVPSLIGFLTYPYYYADESWSYVGVYEAIRGNFFSWGAFDEGQAIFAVHHALALPFAIVSPFEPEVTIRIFAFACAIATLVAVYVCARRLAPRAAWVAPAVIVATPAMFPALRYGRLDVEALMLAAFALAASAYRRPLAAGVLTGICVSIHPIYIWVGAPCLVLAYQDGRRAMRDYVLGGILGVLPQVLWTLVHFEGNREIWQRYAKTNTGSDSGVLDAISATFDRFRTYVESLSTWQDAFHALVFVALPLVAIALARKRTDALLIVSLAVSPIVAQAILIDSPNPYYVHYAGIPLALACAYGVSRLPLPGRIGLMCFVAVALLLVSSDRLDKANESRGTPTIRDIVAMLTRELPRDSVAWIPIMYTGLLDTRPDVRIFTDKSLSLRPGWRLPACAGLDDRLRQILKDDRRSSPEHREVQEVYIVHFEAYLAYLRQTYPAMQADVDCITSGAPADHKTTRFCNRRHPTDCFDITLTRHPLP